MSPPIVRPQGGQQEQRVNDRTHRKNRSKRGGNPIEALENRRLFSVDLSASVSLVSPASHEIKPGRPAKLAIVVTNDGTSAASGKLVVDVGLSRFLGGASPASVATLKRSIKLPAGHHLTISETVKPGVAFALNTYFAVVTVDPADIFNDTNPANNTAVSSTSLVVDGVYPDLTGVWSGPVVVKKGTGKGSVGTEFVDFTNESQTTGSFTFTGYNTFGNVTLNFAGSGTVTKNGGFQDSGTDVPVDSYAQFKAKGKASDLSIVLSYKNALNSGTVTLSRT